MLRRDVRLLVFLATFALLVVALFQWKFQSHGYHPGIGSVGFEKGKGLMSQPDWRGQRHKGIHYTNYKFDPLPVSVINAVDRFLFFVGYARSGHSIVASMLDAHPNVVIAHEYAMFTQWQKNSLLHCNKTWLFNTLYNNSHFSACGGLRTEHAKKKGYSLDIPGWWQGKYDGSISVIGDKSGGMTAQVFRLSHQNFVSLYHQLQSTVQIPVHAIHVVRNPYDNIATMLLYNVHKKKQVNETRKYLDYEGLEHQIISYFNQVRTHVIQLLYSGIVFW